MIIMMIREELLPQQNTPKEYPHYAHRNSLQRNKGRQEYGSNFTIRTLTKLH